MDRYLKGMGGKTGCLLPGNARGRHRYSQEKVHSPKTHLVSPPLAQTNSHVVVVVSAEYRMAKAWDCLQYS
uniref:Uncharacterized protein n=1 Tax=Bracon brevicornis TaxID=1563983 RepID=A0A6V7LCC5_9HYME